MDTSTSASSAWVTTRAVTLQFECSEIEIAAGEALPRYVTAAQIDLLRGQNAIKPAPLPEPEAVPQGAGKAAARTKPESATAQHGSRQTPLKR